MTKTALSARDSAFGALLAAFYPKVPQLQRNYSWGSEEWSDLWLI